MAGWARCHVLVLWLPWFEQLVVVDFAVSLDRFFPGADRGDDAILSGLDQQSNPQYFVDPGTGNCDDSVVVCQNQVVRLHSDAANHDRDVITLQRGATPNRLLDDASTIHGHAIALVLVDIAHRSVRDTSDQTGVFSRGTRDASETVDGRIIPTVDHQYSAGTAAGDGLQGSGHGRLIEVPAGLGQL